MFYDQVINNSKDTLKEVLWYTNTHHDATSFDFDSILATSFDDRFPIHKLLVFY